MCSGLPEHCDPQALPSARPADGTLHGLTFAPAGSRALRSPTCTRCHHLFLSRFPWGCRGSGCLKNSYSRVVHCPRERMCSQMVSVRWGHHSGSGAGAQHGTPAPQHRGRDGGGMLVGRRTSWRCQRGAPVWGAPHTLLLRGTADAEWVPFIGSDGRDVQVDVVPGLEAEGARPLDHQVGDLRQEEQKASRQSFPKETVFSPFAASVQIPECCQVTPKHFSVQTAEHEDFTQPY